MRTIWKFKLQTIGVQYLPFPKGAKILAIQSQSDSPVIWALVDPDEEEEVTRVFLIFGTGNVILDYELSKDDKYIGTYQLKCGGFVGHVFEREKP